jgi:hypothetical protein
MLLFSGGIANACCDIVKSSFSISPLKFRRLNLKFGMAKIFLAKKKLKGGTGNASIVSGIKFSKS